MAKILGINRTQDGSACILANGMPWCIAKERITRQKHHWGKLGDIPIYSELFSSLFNDIELIVESYSSDQEVKKIKSYHKELSKNTINCKTVRVSHHLAHAYSAFFPSGFKDAATMIIDCQGSPVSDFTEKLDMPSNAPKHWLEVSSFYNCQGHEMNCIAKQLWNRDRYIPVGLGRFYLLLTNCIFPGHEGQEGKVMGLAPYGDPHAMGMTSLVVEGHQVFLTEKWAKAFSESKKYVFSSSDKEQFQRSANLAAAGQLAFEQALLEVTNWLYHKTGHKRLCFAGGIALNCAANGRLLRETPFKEIFIPPAPHDGGTALGCALYGSIAILKKPSIFRWENDFLGPEPPTFDRSEIEKDPDLIINTPSNLPKHVAEYLAAKKIVAIFCGRSEFGPRALGHRSILADARPKNMTTWINSKIKGRELFRPLAPIVMLEEAKKWFEINRPLPFMQFAANVRPQYHKIIPAVTHIDGTARIQTVSKNSDVLFYKILKSFQQISNVPVLINTSLNGPGEPIAETIKEALRLFRKTPIHALVFPPYFVSKRDEPATVI